MRTPTAERRTILHVIPTLTGGGAERQLALLAAEQSRRGWNVHVALRRTGNYAQHLTGTGVVVHQLGDLRRGHPLLFLRLHALVRKLRPTVMQTWLLQMDIIGGAVALTTRTPWVLTERNSKASYAETPREAWIRYKLGRHAGAIVANSREGAQYWERFVSKRERISVIPNAIDVTAIQRAEPRTVAAVQRPAILCVGRLVPQKAPELVVEALALLPRRHDVELVLLGDGHLRASVAATVERLGMKDQVHLLPYQPDWWGLLKTATALVNVSRFEGQPNVVLEAMAAGCPLIVSDIGPHRELLPEGSALFVAADDAAALARAIDALLDDRDAARSRAAAASAVVKGSTTGAAADAYERVYALLPPRSQLERQHPTG